MQYAFVGLVPLQTYRELAHAHHTTLTGGCTHHRLSHAGSSGPSTHSWCELACEPELQKKLELKPQSPMPLVAAIGQPSAVCATLAAATKKQWSYRRMRLRHHLADVVLFHIAARRYHHLLRLQGQRNLCTAVTSTPAPSPQVLPYLPVQSEQYRSKAQYLQLWRLLHLHCGCCLAQACR